MPEERQGKDKLAAMGVVCDKFSRLNVRQSFLTLRFHTQKAQSPLNAARVYSLAYGHFLLVLWLCQRFIYFSCMVGCEPSITNGSVRAVPLTLTLGHMFNVQKPDFQHFLVQDCSKICSSDSDRWRSHIHLMLYHFLSIHMGYSSRYILGLSFPCCI